MTMALRDRSECGYRCDASRPGPAIWAAGAVAAGVAALSLSLFWGQVVNQDTAWFLVATRRWLEGARLYTDLVEINPPLNFYLTAPAIALADLLGLSDSNAQILFGSLLLGASLGWVWILLAQGTALSTLRRAIFVFCAVLALVMSVPNAMMQREQLLLILILPWLVGHVVLPEPGFGSGGLARAAVAAIGICLKPYFLAFPISLTIWHVLRRRSLRPVLARDNLVIAVLSAAYVVFVHVRHPEYFHDIVPLAVAVYGDFGYSAWTIFRAPRPEVVAPIVFLLAMTTLRVPELPGLGVWAAAIAAAVASYLAQMKGFDYQGLPIQAASALAAAWVLVNVRRHLVVTLFALQCVLSVAGPRLFTDWNGNKVATQLAEPARGLDQIDTVAALTVDIFAGPGTALLLGADWVSRYPSFWPVPGALNGLALADCQADPETCARLREIAQRTLGDIVTDLESGQPDLLIVDDLPRLVFVPGFSWEDFLSQDPRYPAFRAQYRLLAQVPEYTLLVRNDLGIPLESRADPAARLPDAVREPG